MTNGSSHLFYEVGSDLLAKPTALTQLIEGSTVPATIVFCNTPSDTDLVEVLLKKRGVAAKKLIGNITPELAERTLEQLANKELSTIVVTDVAAKNLDIDQFDQLISYSAPVDHETYTARCLKPEGTTRLKTIATLVGPNDIANFMQIQEAMQNKIQQTALPSVEDIQKAKLARIINVAVQKNINNEPKYNLLVNSFFSDKQISKEEKDQVVAMLLQNYLEVLPSLQAATAVRDEDDYEDDDYGQPAYNSSRDSRDSRGNNRRSNDRGGRTSNNNRRQNGNQRRPSELNEEASLQALEAKARIQKREHLPPLREARIYIGKGKNSGLDESGLKTLLQTKAEVSSDDIRRTIVRKDYVFFDVLEEKSDAIIEKLNQDETLLVKKATVISTQRNQATSSEDESLETAPSLEQIHSQQV